MAIRRPLMCPERGNRTCHILDCGSEGGGRGGGVEWSGRGGEVEEGHRNLERSTCDWSNLSGRNLSDQSLSDPNLSDRNSNDQNLSDWNLNDQNLSDRNLSDRNLNDRKLTYHFETVWKIQGLEISNVWNAAVIEATWISIVSIHYDGRIRQLMQA